MTALDASRIDQACLQLAPAAKLLSCDDRGARLQLPGKSVSVQLNDAAARLLRLCDGTRRLSELVPERAESRAFLLAAIELGWVITLPGGSH